MSGSEKDKFIVPIDKLGSLFRNIGMRRTEKELKELLSELQVKLAIPTTKQELDNANSLSFHEFLRIA